MDIPHILAMAGFYTMLIAIFSVAAGIIYYTKHAKDGKPTPTDIVLNMKPMFISTMIFLVSVGLFALAFIVEAMLKP